MTLPLKTCSFCGHPPQWLSKQPGGRDGSFEAPLRALGCLNSKCPVRPHTVWRNTEVYVGRFEATPARTQGYHPFDRDVEHIADWNHRK